MLGDDEMNGKENGFRVWHGRELYFGYILNLYNLKLFLLPAAPSQEKSILSVEIRIRVPVEFDVRGTILIMESLVLTLLTLLKMLRNS